MSRSADLVKDYASQFASHLSGTNENVLHRAYELGRKTLNEGLGVLDVIQLYHDALHGMGVNFWPEAEKERFNRALELIAEILSPFEMQLRGYQESHASLLSTSERLREAKAAAEAANQELSAAYRELQDTQVQLVHAAKMASLGSLVAGIAHEINNPLAFVSNHLSTVKRGVETLLPDIEPHLSEEGLRILGKMRQRLGEMRMGVDRIENLVVKLRTFSRLDEAEVKAIDIEESIESVLTLLQHKIGDRVSIVRDYGEEKMLSCLPGPLNQVIMNIIVNAIDAIEGKGSITIKTSRAGGMFRLSVKDSGKGIPANIRERILEPFFTTKPVGAGTGLGLSISYGIVQRHKGTLEIQSEEGQGTEVVISLPFRAELVPQGHGA